MTDQELIDLMRGAISSEGTLNRAYLSEHFNELPGLNTLYTMVVEQADRIAELVKEIEVLHKEVRLLEIGFDASQAKLAKAVEEMQWALPILKRCLQHPNDIGSLDDFRTVLAKLEK